jgi:hypothetical protein
MRYVTRSTLPILASGLTLALALAGCRNADEGSQAEASGSAAAGIDGVDLTQTVGQSGLLLREYMTHLVNSNANDMWKWQATVTDAKGDQLTLPQDDEEWEDAESAALTLRELTRPLQNVGHGNQTWTTRYNALEAAIDAAIKHAEEKNGNAFYADGVQIDNACVACHMAFVPQLEAPPKLPDAVTKL